MKLKKLPLLVICLLAVVPSCLPASKTTVKQLDQPDDSKIKSFGLTVNDQVIYQFYHKYGFTDFEEHLILILQPTIPLELALELPLSHTELETINGNKFVRDSIIQLDIAQQAQADIRIEATVFRAGPEPLIYTYDGSYKIEQTDSTEVLILSDRKSGLLYIESKKVNSY